MAEVAKLPTRSEGQRAVAVATGIVVGITNDRQITFQLGHEGSETPDAVFRRYLGVMQIADRLKAHYEIPEIEDELFKHRETLANFVEDRDRLVASHEVQVAEWTRLRPEAKAKKLADMNADILAVQEIKRDHFNRGLEAYRKEGRQGSYMPRGAVATDIAKADQAIKTLEKARDTEMERFDRDYDEMIVKAEAEKEQALANVGISIKRYEEAIAEREAKLAKRKQTAEG